MPFVRSLAFALSTATFVVPAIAAADADPTACPSPGGWNGPSGNSNGPTSWSVISTRIAPWVSSRMKYDIACYEDDRYGTYRTDCSGFVSMAWGLDESYDTYELNPTNDGFAGLTHEITWAQIVPGDALVVDTADGSHHHVALVVAYDAATQSGTLAEESGADESGGEVVPTVEVAFSHADPYWAMFTPIRYDNFTPTVSEIVEYAFQANTGSLYTTGTAATKNWALGMKPGTSPSVAVLATGGFEVAFQANTGDLWTVGAAGERNWHLGMMAGSSPSIAALATGGYEVAFEANTTELWTVGTAGDRNWHLGMMRGTSPSIAGLHGGGYEVAFEGNTSDLWTVGTAGDRPWPLGMMRGTSPSIAALHAGGYEVAFQANTTSLWTVGDAGDKNWELDMKSDTSPSIAGLADGGYVVAYASPTMSLQTAGTTGTKSWALGMRSGTSPSIVALPSGGFEAVFQANTTSLWHAGDAGIGPLNLGMAAGTSPSGS